MRQAVTAVTTNVVYGPHNPFKDPEVEQNFWYYLILLPYQDARLTAQDVR